MSTRARSGRSSSISVPGRTLALVVFALLPYFVGLGSLPLTKGNEAFHAEPPREMLELGQYWVPHLNYEPRFEKPPLANWWNLAGYALMGVSEFSYRFSTALLLLLIVAITWRLTNRLDSSSAAGPLAALILATMPNLFYLSRVYSIDVLLTLFTLASLLCFHEARIEAKAGSRRSSFFYTGCALCGLGVLIKGPVSLVLVAGPLLCHAVITRDRWWKSQPWVRGLLVLAGLALPWYLFMLAWFGSQYWRVFFVEENLQRFATDTLGTRHALYYLTTSLVSMFPWCIAFIVWLVCFIRRTEERTSDAWLLVCWFGFILVFFSISSGKRENYLMPLYPAVAIAVARFLASPAASQRPWRGGLAVLPIASVVAFIVLAVVGWKVSEGLGAGGAFIWMWQLAMLIPVALILSLWNLLDPVQTARRIGVALAGIFLVFALSWGMFRPYLPLPEIGAVVNGLPADATIAVIDVNFTHLLFYCRRPLVFVDRLSDLTDRRTAAHPIYYLADGAVAGLGEGREVVLAKWSYFTPSKIKMSKIWSILGGGAPVTTIRLVQVVPVASRRSPDERPRPEGQSLGACSSGRD
ncbi:MAG: ArnT family glycosyltransferase [Acidobacteriota bacterium]